MRNDRLIYKYLCFYLIIASYQFFRPSYGLAQVAPEVGKFGYADTIFVNGKVVSMDDASRSTSIGHVYQALAVKGDKIVKLGTSEEVKALAGTDTKTFDLKGRTMLPCAVA